MATDQPGEITPESNPEEAWERGWYHYAGGLRFWDGGWTEHYAPPVEHQKPEAINYWRLTCCIAVGVFLGWFMVWVLAQAAPDTFYWPVKFVVKDLPEGLR